jgi:hypothetical protein
VRGRPPYGTVASTAAPEREPIHLALTHGDTERRGRGLTDLESGDVVAYYAGLWPVAACAHALLYALVGLCLSRKAEDVFFDRVASLKGRAALARGPHPLPLLASRPPRPRQPRRSGSPAT